MKKQTNIELGFFYQLTAVLLVFIFSVAPFSALAQESAEEIPQAKLEGPVQSNSIPAPLSSEPTEILEDFFESVHAKDNPELESKETQDSSLSDAKEAPLLQNSEALPQPQAVQQSETNQTDSITSEPIDPDLDLNSGKSSAKAVLPETDLSSGALLYDFPLQTPPGRAGLQPKLSLGYNSQKILEESLVGTGWEISGIPYIQRINKNGTDVLYRDMNLSSSISGELVASSTNTYIPKVENGDFLTYIYNSTSTSFSATDKAGITYTYGSSAASRQDKPNDSAKIFKWMVSEIRDLNNNYIKFEYFKDEGQIYPQTITYTGHGVTDGIFTVIFNRESSHYEVRSYRTAFLTKTAYRISSVVVKVNNSTSTIYSLGYASGQNGQRQMLSSITRNGVNQNGSIVSLPPISFSYQINTLGEDNWEYSWVTPPTVTYSCNGQPDHTFGGVLWGSGVEMGDLNGDGTQDVAISSYSTCPFGGGSPQMSYLGPDFSEEGDFILPITLNSPSSPNNSHFLNDLNGDGLADVVGSPYAYLNTGSGFAAASTTYANDYLPVDPSYQTQILDLNGDGLSDYYKLPDKMYRNNGSGFYLDTELSYKPAYGSYVYYAELNGDGLIDAALSTHRAAGGGNPEATSTWASLNDGYDDFVDGAELAPPIVLDELNNNDSPNSTHNYTLADINGDSLADIVGPGVYINTGNGWDQITFPYEIDSADPRYFRIMDYNSDGMPDIVHEDGEMWLSQKPVPDLLKKVTYPTGGFTEITYQSSHSAASTTLPYAMQVVKSIVTKDGLATSSVETLNYSGGKNYFSSAAPLDRRFAGFGQVEKSDAAGNLSSEYYHQGDSSDSSRGENADNFWKIGKPYRLEYSDPLGNLYFKQINKWESATSTATSTAAFVKLSQVLRQSYDGASTHKDVVESSTYNDATGDILEKVEWGEVSGSNDGSFSDTGSDKLTTTYTYASSSTTTVMSLLSSKSLLDQNSLKLNESKYYYDNLALGRADKGNLTKLEDWKSSNNYVDVEKVYNSYGLVTQEKDPRDKTTILAYDAANLYVASSTNPMGHVSRFVYDYSTGKVATTTDANGNIFANVYDGLGRLLEQRQPNPSSTSTLESKTAWTYSDVFAASSVYQTDYLNSATSSEVYIYMDGLGRKKQERREAEGSNYAVRDFAYNDLGLLQKESLPYFSVGSSTTSATSTLALFTFYSYDPLKRVKNVVNSLGTTTTTHLNWKTTLIDPNGNSKDLTKDAYKNLVRVDEYALVQASSSPVTSALYDTPLYTDDNLESYWRLEGSSTDAKGQNDGTDSNISYDNSYGKFGEGASFNKNSPSKISTGMSGFPTGSSPRTISAWIYPSNLNTAYYSTVFTYGSQSAHHINDLSLYYDSDNNKWALLYDTWGEGVAALTDISMNNWYFVTATFDGSVMKLYLNGSLLASQSASAVNTPSGSGFIGVQNNGSGNPWNGYIDDVAVFSRALTDTEIGNLYSGFPVSSVWQTFTTHYEYDGNGNLTKITDAQGNVRNFTYDGLNRRLTSEDLHYSGDGTYGSYTYTYDDAGNLTQMVDPKSQTVNYTYDDINRQLAEDYIGNGGTEVVYTYDTCTQGRGRLCSASSSSVSIANAYNASGHLVASTSTINSVVYPAVYTYDRQGNPLVITKPDNSEVRYSYNNAGLVETVHLKESTDASYQGLVTNLDYGPHGKITYQVNANCTETTNTYDASQLYRLIQKVTVKSCGGESMRMSLAAAPSTKTLQKATAIKFPKKSAKTFQKPARPEEISTSTPDHILPEPESSTSTLQNQPAGETGLLQNIILKISKWAHSAGKFLARQLSAAIAYALTTPSELLNTPLYSDSSLKSYWRLEGNANDSIGSNHGSATGVSYGSNYGMFGQGGSFDKSTPSKISTGMSGFPTGSSPRTISAWVYPSNLSTVYFSTAFTYGAQSAHDINDLGLYYDSGYWVAFYDTWGETASAYTDIALSSWHLLTGTFDGSYLRLYVDGELVNTASASSVSTPSGNGFMGIQNNGSGNPWNGYIDDVAVFSRALTDNEVLSLYTGNWNGIQNISYVYDKNGNITQIEDISETHAAKTVDYAYDSLNRLTRASTTITSASTTPYRYSYTYDALGNMLSRTENGSTTTYTYATNTPAYLNPHAVATTTAGSALAYTYDNNGNLLTVRQGTTTPISSYTWDYNNRMTQAVVNGTATSTYAYDTLGQRVKQTVGATSTIYSSKFYNITGSTPTKNIFLPDGTLIATVVGTGTTTTVSYIHTDHLGGTNVATDDGGAVVELTDYYPYGSARLDEQSGLNSQRKFIGEVYDADTGLNYLNARYYNANSGKFISQDAFIRDYPEVFIQDPQQLNYYSYARNNPITLSDPSGNFSIGGAAKSVWNSFSTFFSNLFGQSNNNTSQPKVSTPTVNVQNNTQQTTSNSAVKTTTWDSKTDERIKQLDPRLQQPATNFINEVESQQNIQLRVTQGYRSIEEQNSLYAQGRTTKGNIVTNAKGGDSYHNYGLAFDVVVMEKGEARWDKPINKDIANIAVQQGFEWGGTWSSFPDYPHFQMTFGQSLLDLKKGIK